MYNSYRQTSPGVTPGNLTLDENQALGILKHLDLDELQRLHDSEGKLDDLVNDLQQVKSLQIDREMCLTSNKSLAEFNISRQPRFTQGIKQLAAMYEEAATLRKSYEKNKEKLDFLAAEQSLDTTLALLQTAAAESEENSEELADNFLDGKVDSDTFVEEYIQLRKKTHLLKVKAEKMPGLIQQQNSPARASRQNSGQVPGPVAGTNQAPGNSYGQPPYPANTYPGAMPNLSNYR
ncbi:unnamed protein product [Owenia fusiformis]|uniref:VPS37 C-terminal domain-containing protein n=1 Tax=Owenia fusiformis TaxID=6347 RepID=A0A8S4Q5T6_OWEFU|nr:unnamed protein product [Owenia fusiformis]